jgi:hypothetical protein
MMSPTKENEDYILEAPGRLIDEIVAYIRDRQKSETDRATARIAMDEERLLRATLRHLRHHPLPTALLGISAAWLLLADETAADEPISTTRPQIEDEIIKQAKGGYAYTHRRLRTLVDRHPWAAAAAIVGGGLLAAILFPERERPPPQPFPKPHPVDEEVMPGEDYGFDPQEDETK